MAWREATGKGKKLFGQAADRGIIPKDKSIDFWRYINLEQLKSLRIGGRVIELTQPQSRMATDLIYTSAVSPRAAKWSKRLGRLSSGLQLPRNVLKAALTGLRLKRTAAFLRGPGRTGGLVGGLMGGLGGAAIGFGAELLGRGAAKIARQLMRDPSNLMLRDVIRAAVKQESSRAHKKLLQAKRAFDQHGKTAFRALIYDAMHDPDVRKAFELVSRE
jgi:hypothetical protein